MTEPLDSRPRGDSKSFLAQQPGRPLLPSLVYFLSEDGSASYRATIKCLTLLGCECKVLNPDRDIPGRAYVLIPMGSDPAEVRRRWRVPNVFLMLSPWRPSGDKLIGVHMRHGLLGAWQATHERPPLLRDHILARAVESSLATEARYLSHELRRGDSMPEEIVRRTMALLKETGNLPPALASPPAAAVLLKALGNLLPSR